MFNPRDEDIMVMLLTAQVGAPPHHCAAAVPARVIKAKAFIFVYLCGYVRMSMVMNDDRKGEYRP